MLLITINANDQTNMAKKWEEIINIEKKSKYLHFEQLNLDKIYTKKYGEYQMFLDIVAKLELKLQSGFMGRNFSVNMIKETHCKILLIDLFVYLKHRFQLLKPQSDIFHNSYMFMLQCCHRLKLRLSKMYFKIIQNSEKLFKLYFKLSKTLIIIQYSLNNPKQIPISHSMRKARNFIRIYIKTLAIFILDHIIENISS